MSRFLIIAGIVLALGACSEEPEEVAITGDAALDLITQEGLHSHLAYLAGDALEGREPSHEGYALAATYVAEQFAEIGLAPGGSEGWYQPVELQTILLDQDSPVMTVHRDGGDAELAFRDEFVTSGDKVRAQVGVRGEVVYVGYGIHAPEYGYSDLDGVDLEGKIVAYFSGGPASITGDKLAHFSSSRNKAKEWAARGAVGAISLYSRHTEESFPWERAKQVVGAKPGKTWVNAAGEAAHFTPEMRGFALISPAYAADMFRGTPISFEEARDTIEASESASVPLGFEVTLSAKTSHERITSPNVIGLLRGTDPELAAEYVVYTAHLDHIGRSVPVDGDDIYNGMYDNAMGIAIMIEAARALAVNPPRRSVLFVALTAEESGLLGSDYFAHYPTVAKESIVANVNMDMPLFLFPLNEMVAFGAEHSSLGAVAEAAATAEGLVLTPDPLPEEILFSRSDQFSFVQKGIPAIWLSSGNQSTDPNVDGPAVLQDHMKNHYHQPSDDLTRPIYWDAALRFTRANARIGWAIANDDARPTWNEGDFYGDMYAPQ
jgi:hypothetical protein